MKIVFLLMSLLMMTNLQASELYRSIDKDGKVHYSDTPLQGSEDVEKLNIGKEPTPDENMPYETQVASKNFPVSLYTFPTCSSVCQQARELLTKRGIPFTEKSISSKEEIEAFRKESGDGQYPTLKIGKTWLKGFQAEQWHQELDFAGYPKSAPLFRPRPVTPPSTQPAT